MQLRRFNSTRPLQGHEQEGRPHEKWAAETREQCKGIMGIADMFLIGFNLGHGNSPFLNNSTGRQHPLLSPLVCLPAKAGGAVNGGAYAPFILTVDWLGWLCYF